MLKYISLRWPGRCALCARKMTKGSQAIFLFKERKVACLDCEGLVKEREAAKVPEKRLWSDLNRGVGPGPAVRIK